MKVRPGDQAESGYVAERKMKGLGKKRNTIIGVVFALAFTGGYWGMMEALDRAVVLNDEVVEPGRLIRSAQPWTGDLDKMLKEEGLGTIVCLRGYEEEPILEWAGKNGVKLICMKMKADDPPTAFQVGLFFDIMRGDTVRLDRYSDVIVEKVGVDGPAVKFPFPILIHCEGGADRTGVMVALYRMTFQGWELDRARRDMIKHFHVPFLHPAQFRFLEKIAPELSPGYGSLTLNKERMLKRESDARISPMPGVLRNP